MHFRFVAAPLLIAALVGACSGAASSPAPSAAPVTAPSAAVASAPASSSAADSPAGGGDGYGNYKSGGSASAAADSGGGIALATTSLGSVLVGPSGKTLYLFTPDTGTTSACTGSCAANGPPLTGAMPSLGTGLNTSDFGTLTRADGTTQISFHGHPLYYYAGDQAAGDTHGQGLLEKWYVLGADGNPIK